MGQYITRIFGGAAILLAAASLKPAAAQQTMNDGRIGLSASCNDLKSTEGRKLCSQALELFANALKDKQIEAATAPRYVSFGSQDNPVMVLVREPMKESFATIEILNAFCDDIASKKPREKDSARLDDGSEVGTLRVAERAGLCAENAGMVSGVTSGPIVFDLAAVLHKVAEEVIPQVNGIADKKPIVIAWMGTSGEKLPSFRRN